MIPESITEKEFVYRNVPHDKVVDFRNEFVALLEDFASTVDMDAQLEVNDVIISHICKRVDQRKDYYMYYHSTADHVMRMSHEKEMGLWAYWVSKYKPVRFVNKVHDQLYFMNNGCTVSDAFAAYIIISIVCNSKESRASYFTEDKVQNLFYDMANRDFSKEAIISRIEDLIA